MAFFIKHSDGWKYFSICGKFSIVNLKKAYGGKNVWVLRSENEEFYGEFKTLKEAKLAAR